MTVSFNPLKANGQLFTHLPELDDLELSLSNANAADVLDALGIEAAFSASPWPLPCFKALLVVARRKRIGHASPAIPLTETREPSSMVLIDCGRDEGYIERKLALLSDLVNRAAELGATMSGGAEARQSTRQRANLTQRTHTILDTDRKTSRRQLHSTHGLHFASRYCTNYRGPCVW
jgi:hypothetical protein